MAKRFGKSFKPEYHSDRILAPRRVKKPSKIFVCSMADLFGEWVPNEWIDNILSVVRECPQHTFQFLTKNPKRLIDFSPWPKNCWVGATTVNQGAFLSAIVSLENVFAPVRFVSVDPILGPVGINGQLDWVIIGAETGPGAREASPLNVLFTTRAAMAINIPIFHKDNLGSLATRKEWPHE